MAGLECLPHYHGDDKRVDSVPVRDRLVSDKYRPVPEEYRNAPDCPARPKSPLPHVLNDVAAFAFQEYRYLPAR